MTRRLLTAAALTTAALATAAAPPKTGTADRVFVNGKIWTGEPGKRPVEALAVRGRTLLEVGSSAQVRKLAGKGTDVVDLRGRFVVPGLIDGHVHLLGGGRSLEELRLDDADDFGSVAAQVGAWAKAHPEARWVTGEGWSYGAFPGGLPTRTQLDALVPDRPAYLESYDGHTGWANSAALRLAEITRATKDPQDGEIVRDASGEPTGVLKESAAGLVKRLLAKPLPHEDERSLRRAIEQAAAWGLTGVHQAGISEAELEILARALQSTPRLRVYVALAMERNPTPELLARQDRLRQRYATPRLRVGAVKGYVDGVVESRTAAMFQPFAGGGGAGRANFTQEELDRAVAAYDAAGWQVMLHAIGDRAIDMALTAFEHAARANGTSGRRHRVEHIEVPRREDLPRFKAAGVVASTQALFAYPGPNHMSAYVPVLGPERASRAMPFKSIDDAGAVQAFGSDWPVFSAEVVQGLACAVTRATKEGTPAGGWEPAERLSVAAALRHFTRDAAWAEGREQERGTLQEGRAADFTVLSQDLLSVPPERIRDTKVLLTVLAGDDSYRAPRVLMAVYTGKVVIVTGASQGIGRALCLALAPQRPRLVLAARDQGALAEVQSESESRGAETLVVPTDVGDEAACRALVAAAVARFSGIDVLVNNAGIGMLARFEDVSDLTLYERLMRVNYLGSVYPTFHALPHLKQSRGQVVAVSSLAGLVGVPMRTAYAATKHAQMGFFNSLRIELLGTGVSVTVVAPYFVQSQIRLRSPGPDGRTVEASPIHESEIMSAEECARLIVRAMEKRQRMLVMTLKGRLGRWLGLAFPLLVDHWAAEAVRKGR